MTGMKKMKMEHLNTREEHEVTNEFLKLNWDAPVGLLVFAAKRFTIPVHGWWARQCGAVRCLRSKSARLKQHFN